MEKNKMDISDEELQRMASGLALQVIAECGRRTFESEVPWLILTIAAKVAEEARGWAGSTNAEHAAEFAAAERRATERMARLMKAREKIAAQAVQDSDRTIGLKRGDQ